MSRRPPGYGIGFADSMSESTIHSTAHRGIAGSGIRLPHAAAIQRSFGGHDVSSIVAHTDAAAGTSAAAIGALAYARGEHVAFAGQPGLHLAAHEAAHVVQQRSGIRPNGSIGRAGDRHERNADAVAERVVAGRSAVDLLPRPGASAGRSAARAEPAVQRYQVLGPNKIYGVEPRNRPWFGYPYAVAAGGDLVSQIKRDGVDDDFLDANGSNTAWTAGAGNNFSLRVSNDNQMAVEDSDLTDRQPKVFFATQAIVDASNQALQAVRSRFTLQGNAGTTVKILTGWWKDTTLREVRPRYQGGSPDNAPQNCNAIAGRLTGVDPEMLGGQGGGDAVAYARRRAPNASRQYQAAYNAPVGDDPVAEQAELDRLTNEIAREYVGNRSDWSEWWHGSNKYAQPDVGRAFVIASLGTGPDIGGGRQRVRDYESNTLRDLGWPYHFGGVVARSGDDRITLENYARGDGRANNADPRWYFQMYGMATGQSFHEFHKAKREYANPVTRGVGA